MRKKLRMQSVTGDGRGKRTNCICSMFRKAQAISRGPNSNNRAIDLTNSGRRNISCWPRSANRKSSGPRRPWTRSGGLQELTELSVINAKKGNKRAYILGKVLENGKSADKKKRLIVEITEKTNKNYQRYINQIQHHWAKDKKAFSKNTALRLKQEWLHPALMASPPCIQPKRQTEKTHPT